jgi:hypothetical protein
VSLCGWSRFLKRVGEETGEFLSKTTVSFTKLEGGFYGVEVTVSSTWRSTVIVSKPLGDLGIS